MPPRRAVQALLLGLVFAALSSLFYSGWVPWKSPEGYRMVFARDALQVPAAPQVLKQAKEPQLPLSSHRSPLAPLEITALRANFPRLKEATRRHSGRFNNRLEKMMTSYLPVVNTDQWKLHSPNGAQQFTVEQVQALSVASIGADFLVPNVAHFILPFGDTNLQFHHMVSILSCLHVMRPHRLLLWYAPGRLPRGEWWDRVTKNLTESEWEQKVIMVQRSIPTSVYSVSVQNKEHQSDVMRMEAVLTFGGVYMDIDVFVLKPLEPLRKFTFTIGRQDYHGLCNGVFMSVPNGTFLAMWHSAYQVFNDGSWVDHSVWLPHTLQPIFPELCHVEDESMDRPNWTQEEVNWIYGIGQQHRWDWRNKNYVMHLWFRKYGQQHNMDSILLLDSIYGEMCRFILFGTT